MLTTFERFAQQEYIGAASQDAFLAAIPLRRTAWRGCVNSRSRARISALKTRRKLQLRHDMMRAKLSGYIDRPAVVFNRYPPTEQRCRRVMRGPSPGISKAGRTRSKPHWSRSMR